MTPARGDRWRVAWLAARHGLRRVRAAILRPVHWLTGGVARTPERLLIAPHDLRTSDPTVASDIHAGYFAFAGKVVATGGRSPFALTPPSEAWAEALAGFVWLRHLRAADSALARAQARALVDDWIAQKGRRGVGWSTQVTARRITSWLSQSPLLLDGADHAFYTRFLRSIGRQAAYLARRLAGREERDERRLYTALALAYVAVCTEPAAARVRRAVRPLAEALDRQILPDGGHLSRSPRVLVDLLVDLLPLRQAFAARGLEAPRALLGAIDRMMPMLRLFRHGDGALALFNGMSATQRDALATLLAYTDPRARPIENAPHSGYQRLQGGTTVVVIDAGAPPPLAFSGRAHAGCLSFELSDGVRRIIVNCGAPPPGAEHWREPARATAAHSTAGLIAASSCRFAPAIPGLLGTPVLAGPRDVPVKRTESDAATEVTASHDGYRARFGLVHRRRLALPRAGGRLDGEDAFDIVDARRAGVAPNAFALRFHLHPLVQPALEADGRAVRLTLPGGLAWRFDAGGRPLAIEVSVFLGAPDGARTTRQIVVHGAFRDTPTIAWSFVRLGQGASVEDEVREALDLA